MKNTAMHKCYYLVQPTNMREKLNIELFCKFGKVKVTVPSPPRLLYKGVSCTGGNKCIAGECNHGTTASQAVSDLTEPTCTVCHTRVLHWVPTHGTLAAGLPPIGQWELSHLLFCVCVPVPRLRSSPSEGPQSQARMDSGSRTMYSLHLGTCSFAWVRGVSKGDTTGGKTWEISQLQHRHISGPWLHYGRGRGGGGWQQLPPVQPDKCPTSPTCSTVSTRNPQSRLPVPYHPPPSSLQFPQWLTIAPAHPCRTFKERMVCRRSNGALVESTPFCDGP